MSETVPATIQRNGWTYPNPDFQRLTDVRTLVSAATLKRIGAKRKPGEFAREYAVWTINPPTIGEGDGPYFLVLDLGQYGIHACIAYRSREDRPAQMVDVGYGPYKAWTRNLEADQVDGWVLAYCTRDRDALLPIALGWTGVPA